MASKPGEWTTVGGDRKATHLRRHLAELGLPGESVVLIGDSLDDAKKKHQFDLYYVKNNSLLLDVLVLIETVSVVIFREGQ